MNALSNLGGSKNFRKVFARREGVEILFFGGLGGNFVGGSRNFKVKIKIA